MADAERLGPDRVSMNLLGLEKGADQTTLGEWLRAQDPQSVRPLHRLNGEFVDWAKEQAKPGGPSIQRAGSLARREFPCF